MMKNTKDTKMLKNTKDTKMMNKSLMNGSLKNDNTSGFPFKYDAWYRTDVMESDEFTFVWSISKFSERPEKTGEFIPSQEFIINGPEDKVTKWRVLVYPKGRLPENSNHIGVYLYNDTKEEIEVSFSFSLLDVKKNKVVRIVEKGYKMKPKTNWGNHRFCHKTDIHRLAPNDILTVVCDVTVKGIRKDSIVMNDLVQQKNPEASIDFHLNELVQDIEKIFSSKDHFDVVLECGEERFECHKNILSARSPVFRAMFEANMKESNSGTVEIEDIEPDVLLDMLNFIYTGISPNLDNHAKDLLVVADKYQMETLKKLCESKLCTNLAHGNCIEMIIFGDMYQASKLKSSALQVASRSVKKLKTSDWTKNLAAYPALMGEVVEAMLGNKDAEETATEDKYLAAT